MTLEDKDLLLKDLCARLPYGVKVNFKFEPDRGEAFESCGILESITNYGMVEIDSDKLCGQLLALNDEIKPYLFPLSSMTVSQCYKLASIHSGFQDCWKYVKTPIPLEICNFKQIDWFNRNHLDYRGLIEKGLAIDATNLNIY